MLTIIIPGEEFYDEELNEFSSVDDVFINLEHSLVSLSKWESKYKKPFLGKDEKTDEEILYYIECMLVDKCVSTNTLSSLTQQDADLINQYINSSETATTFGAMPPERGPQEIITSELIYFWMISFNIPFECQHWHLNRLFALIRVCNIKNSKPKKMSRHEAAMRNRALNAKRREELASSG